MRTLTTFALAATLAFCSCAQEPETFTNPLTEASVPDPTVFDGEDGYYYLYYTGGFESPLFRSKDLVNWENSGICPFSEETRKQLGEIAAEHNSDNFFYAPTVKKMGDNFVMYISLTWKAMVALRSSGPTGPFEFDGEPYVLIDNSITGLEITNEDSCVATDLDGTNYLMWGSHGNLTRTTLSSDGLRLADGATFDHVAGNPREPRRVYEGLYAYWHDGFWYLFAAKGDYTSDLDPYEVVVGRCETLGGRFLDKKGRPMDKGFATRILVPDNCDTYLGGGHTGEIFKDKAGRYYIFYQRQLADVIHYRPLFLQQIFWAEDGWPYFKNGFTQLKDINPEI